MTSKVECYAGSTYPESPRALTWQGQRYTVSEITQRWREPEGVGFSVCCEPYQALFDLFYQIEEAMWTIQPRGYDIIKADSLSKPTNQGD